VPYTVVMVHGPPSAAADATLDEYLGSISGSRVMSKQVIEVH
jgi:hypothetical protein